MKNILIPTDFSQNARNALTYALDYFAKEAVNFYILHISNFEEDWIDADADFELVLTSTAPSQTQKSLQQEIEYCTAISENPAHTFIPKLSRKSLIEGIRQYVTDQQIDYIVMGTRGASKAKKVGSNTYEVISKVKCPTIIVPELTVYHDFKNIALPTDYNNWDQNKMFINLYETLLFKKAGLHILEIQNENQSWTEPQKATKSFLLDLVRKLDHQLYVLTNEDIDNTIQKYINEHNIDMIALVGKNINFVQRLLFQPKSKKITYRLEKPFLILHE